MPITFVAAGAFASGTGALTVGQPAGHAAGDLLLLFVESANQAVATPSGYTLLSVNPPSTGTAATAGGVRLTGFYKIAASGAEPSVSVADSGDHTTARIFGFRGVDRLVPFEDIRSDVGAASTAMSWPAATSFTHNTMVVLAAAMDTDAASTTTCTGYANAGLTSITEQADQTVASGVGGGLVLATGLKATPGAIAASTATGSTAVTHAYFTVVLRSQSDLAANAGSGPIGFTTSMTVATNGFQGIVGSAYGNGVFVGLRNDISVASSAVTSSNGTTWTSTSLTGTRYSAIAFGNGIFLAVSSTDTQAATSTDGTTWTPRTMLTNGSRQSRELAFGNGVFFLPTGTTTQEYTTDGITWNTVTLAPYDRAVFGNGVFLIYQQNSTAVAYGFPGVGFNSATVPFAFSRAVFANGRFFAVGTAGQTATSPDGQTWTTKTTFPFSSGELYAAFDEVIFASTTIAHGYVTTSDGGALKFSSTPDFEINTALERKTFSRVQAGDTGVVWFPNNSNSKTRGYFSSASKAPTAAGALTNAAPSGNPIEASASCAATASATLANANPLAPTTLLAASTATGALTTRPRPRDESPAFVGSGAFQSGVGALTVPVPAGTTQNDLLVLAVETANQPVATPGGWTQVGSTQSLGTAAAANSLSLQVFYKLAGASEGSAAVADSGDHTTAQILGYRGVDTSFPIENVAQNTYAFSNMSSLENLGGSFLSPLTRKALTLTVVGLDSDANASPAVTYTVSGGADAVRFNDRGSNTTNAGTGGGLAFFDFNLPRYGDTDLNMPGITGTAPAAGFYAYTTLNIAPAPRSLLSNRANNVAAEVSTYDDYATAPFAYGANRWVGKFNSVAAGAKVWLDGAAGFAPAGVSAYSVPLASALTGLAFGAGLFVAAVNGGTTATSPDGITWTAGGTIPLSGDVTLRFVGGLFIAANGTSAIATSSNGTTWSSAITLPTGSKPFTGVVHTGAKFIASSHDGSNSTIVESVAGASWSLVADVTGRVLNLREYGNSMLAAVNAATQWQLSDDGGLTWFDTQIINIVFHEDKFYGRIASSDRVESDEGYDWRVSTIAVDLHAYSGRSSGKVIYGGPGTITQRVLPEPPSGTSTASSTLSSGPILLAASPASIATSSGALTTSVRLNTAASASASVTAAATTAIRLAAAEAAQSTSSAGLTTAILPVASASAVGLAAAALTTSISLAASVFAEATSAATLISVPATLASSAEATCSASAALTTSVQANAALAVEAAATAALTMEVRLVSNAAIVGTATADLTASIRVAADAAGVASTSAALTTQVALAAGLDSQATANASLTTQVRLAGAVASQATTSADATVSIQLAAAALCSTTTSATLGSLIALEAMASAAGVAAADLGTAILLTASASVASEAVSSIQGSAATLESQVAVEATTIGSLTGTAAALQSSAEVQVAAASALSTLTPIAGAAEVSATAAADLGTRVELVGTTAASAAATASLTGVAAELSAACVSAAQVAADLFTRIQFQVAANTGAAAEATAELLTAIQLAAAATAQASASTRELVIGADFVGAMELRRLVVPAELTTVAVVAENTVVSVLAEPDAVPVFAQPGGVLTAAEPTTVSVQISDEKVTS